MPTFSMRNVKKGGIVIVDGDDKITSFHMMLNGFGEFQDI